MKLNILFVSTRNPYPPDHGHTIRTYNTLKCISKGNNIYLLAFVESKEKLNIGPLKKFCKTVDFFIIPEDVKKWRFFLSLFFNVFSPLPFVAHKYYRKEMRKKIEQVLTEYKIDIVHLDMLPLARYFKVVKAYPTVLVDHNVESLRILRWAEIEKNILTKMYMYLQYLKLFKFEKKMCSKFDRCITVSEFDKKALENLCPNGRFTIIPNGVDTEYFKGNNIKIVPNSLIWVGGMRSLYNREAVNYFVDEILSLIQLEIPDVKVTFVGSSPPQKLFEISKINSSIRYTGFVEDVRPYVEEAAVYIAPIRSGSGTKLKILNALSLSKAVVTTSIGAEGIDVTPNENILIADSPQDFAQKTIELLRNPDIAEKIGKAGRKLIEGKYNWKIICSKMNQVYEEIIKEGISK